MVINPSSSGSSGGENTTPFFEIQKEETTQYLLYSSGYSVVVAIYPISTDSEPCIFLPLTNMLSFGSQNGEINLPSGYVTCSILVGNYRIRFTSEDGSRMLDISIGGDEVLPDGWSARYFAYRGN